MRWFKRVSVPEVPDDLAERSNAIRRSTAELAIIRSKDHEVEAAVRSAEEHLSVNHIAQRLYQAYGARG